jgi:hypothetical protein
LVIPNLEGADLQAYLNKLLGQITPRPTAKHVTVFTDIDEIGTHGYSSGGVLLSGTFSGTGVSFIGSPGLNLRGTVVAHEWGHTFGLGESVVLPSLMNPVLTLPLLTITERRKARDYVGTHYR